MLQFLKFSSSRNIFILLFSLQTFSLQCMEQKIKEVAREFAENAGTTRPALTSQEYLQSLNNVIENPSGDARISTNMNALIHRLEKHKVADLIAKEAGLSKFCDSGKERLYKAFAHILEAYAVAAHLPTAQERDNLQAKLAQEHQQKEALRIEKDQIIAKQEKRGDIYKDSWLSAQSSAEQLRNDLTSLTARSVDLEANLNQAKETHIQDLDQIEIGLAIINQRDADVELQRRRIARMVELLQKATEDKRQLEEQQQKTLAQLEATRKQMAEQSSQSAEEYMKVRRQLSPLREERMHANLQTTQAQKQISNLQHLNAQLIRQLEEARQQLKEKNIIKKKNG